MNGLALICTALTISAGAAALAACGGSQPPIGAPGAMPHAHAIAQHAHRGTSGDLVYLTIYGETEVFVYSYPDGKRVGALSGFKNTVAVCSDSSGDVWVIDSDSRSRSTLLKYAHGGSKPMADLRLDERADACSVDPSTGNLAAATLNSSVAIWKKGQGSPTLFSTSAFFKKVQTIAYDGMGNLYMRSFASGESGAWLPKGRPSVTKFYITKLGFYGWDGRYFVIGSADGGTGPLTRYKLHNGDGEAVGKVSVKLCAPGYAPPSFSIAGSELALSCGVDETNSLNYYTYPKGGKPIKVFVPGGSGSVTISAS
jgi:hypothetical protein